MAYTDQDFKTKKALKESIKNGESVYIYQPGGMFPLAKSKTHCVEGPHYPKPHTWYATVEVDENDKIIKVIS